MIADQTGDRRRVGKLHDSRRAIFNSIRQGSIRRAGDLPSLWASEVGSNRHHHPEQSADSLQDRRLLSVDIDSDIDPDSDTEPD